MLLPIWKPQHKSLTINDILHKAPDTVEAALCPPRHVAGPQLQGLCSLRLSTERRVPHAQGVDECVMVRATPRTLYQDEDDDSAFQQAAPPTFKRKEAGVAKGSAAAEQAGADGTARKAQKQRQKKLPPQQWSPTQVSPATTAGTSPMCRSQFVAAVTPEEVD